MKEALSFSTMITSILAHIKIWSRKKFLKSISDLGRFKAFSTMEIILEENEEKGIIILNRPKTLNALTLNMDQKILSVLKKWETEKSLVIIKSSSDKAFCAGGDVKTVLQSRLKGDKSFALNFQQVQMQLCKITNTYGIPFVALMNGIVMGAGSSISVHGRYRVATEKTVFAMPEASIGFIPDVGSSYFLPRLNGKLGLYLALTAQRLKGPDVYRAGIATHYCQSKDLPKLEEALLTCTSSSEVDTVLNQLNQQPIPEFSLTKVMPLLNWCFSRNSVEEIFVALDRDGSDWSINVLKQLKRISPTSLKLVFKQMTLGARLDLNQCILMEYRIICSCLEKRDFYEDMEVILEENEDKGIIIINRPKALNALTLDMEQKIISVLKKWETEKSLVIIKSSSEKAFCAGGDIKAVTQTRLKGDKSLSLDLQQAQMQLCKITKTYAIPFVALINGIVMGAGSSISVHGRYRVATEKTVFAMPEASIGFIPDAGSSYFLPRLNGKLGLYLALTAQRLKGPDVYRAGIATHYCQSKDLPKLEEALLKCTSSSEIDAVLNQLNQQPIPEFSLMKVMPLINWCFSRNSVEEIFVALDRDGSDWSINVLKQLKRISPTSLRLVFKEMTLGARLDLNQCILMEYRLICSCLEKRDFYEGIRANVIDKDFKPKWNPPTLSEVSNEYVDEHFQPTPSEGELLSKL